MNFVFWNNRKFNYKFWKVEIAKDEILKHKLGLFESQSHKNMPSDHEPDPSGSLLIMIHFITTESDTR